MKKLLRDWGEEDYSLTIGYNEWPPTLNSEFGF